MKRIILLIIILMIRFSISSQNSKATITLNNGTVKTGLARIKYLDESVKFRTEKGATKEFIDFNDIKSIRIIESGEVVDYVIKYIKIINDYTNDDDEDDDDDDEFEEGNKNNKNKEEFQYSSPLLLKVEIIGKINLYSNYYTSTMGTGMMYGGNEMMYGGTSGVNGMMIGGVGTNIVYYVSRNNSEFINTLTNFVGGGFKKRAMEFFKDCPSLVQKIKTKKFKKQDLEDIVKYYNTNCGN